MICSRSSKDLISSVLADAFQSPIYDITLTQNVAKELIPINM